MDIKRCTIDSQDILRHENARAFFVCLLSFVLSLLILGAALFGVYSLYTVSGLDKEKYSVPILSLLYALFRRRLPFLCLHCPPFPTTAKDGFTATPRKKRLYHIFLPVKNFR